MPPPITQQNDDLPLPSSEVTVDNIEVAQFVYLLLHNEKIRDVIDTVGKKGVLLLGRFTEGRIAVLALPIHDDLRFRAFAAFGSSGRTGSFGFFTA